MAMDISTVWDINYEGFRTMFKTGFYHKKINFNSESTGVSPSHCGKASLRRELMFLKL
jgi:hypothetical protein